MGQFDRSMAMARTRRTPPRVDFHSLGEGAWSTFLYGSPRSLVDRVGYAMAHVNDPNPTWVDIRDPEGSTDASSPGELGWVPEDHLYFVSPAEARPQEAGVDLALWTVVRSDEPDSVIAGFTDFLRLPPKVQVAVSRIGTEPTHPVLVIANSDRVRAYYPKETAGVRRIIDAMLQTGVLPIFAAVGPPGPGRLAFDFVFEVESPRPDDWRAGSLTCHKAPPGIPIPIDTPIPLASVSQAIEFLERRPSTKA